MFKRFGILALLVFLLFNTFALAQLFDSIGGTLEDANIGNTLGTTPPATPTDTSGLTYTPDPTVSAEVLQQFINNLSATGQATPEQIAQFEEVAKTELTREKMQQFIDQLFVDEGFKLENIADVFSMYLIASFAVLNDMTNGTTTEQDLIVRDQVVAAFGSTPEITQLSDKDKQTFAESLILFIIFLANDWQQALQGVEGYDLEAVKSYTRGTLLQMNIDPAQFDFTPQGLIRKGQGGQTTTQQTPEQQTPQTTPTTQTPDTQQTNTQDNPLGGSNPLGGADPFVGSFSGENISLTLQGADNTYTGELVFNGTPYPVQATASGTNLTGTFTSGGSTFNFTATLQDTALTLVSDGSTFNLTKQ